ncbi:Ff.00g028120.m01.CDS01 [Fusarium sp. VM40]|nr:Ff.00g028120.m01.CDS01 [Fusarium sp. VM40]
MSIHEVKLLHHIDDGQTLIKRLSSFLAQANGRPHPSETFEDTRDAFEVL